MRLGDREVGRLGGCRFEAWRRVKPLTPFDCYNSSLYCSRAVKKAMKTIQFFSLRRYAVSDGYWRPVQL